MAQNDDGRTVYVVRMNIAGHGDIVKYGLEANRIAVGYSEVPGLIEIADDQYAIREAIKKAYFWNNRKAGKSAGELRRFLGGMQQDDLVLVPHGNDVHLAKVAGPPGFDENMPEGAAYYRDVEWLNGKEPFPRHGLASPIQHHVGPGTRNTLREVPQIRSQVKALEEGRVHTDKTFQDNLRKCLEKNAMDVLKNGNMNPKDFEYFLYDLFTRLFGAIGNRRSGSSDKGADIVLDILPPHDLLASKVVIQAKYHVAKGRITGKDAVDQILDGMDAEEADLGIVITTGEFDDAAKDACEKANPEDHRANVLLWDGPMLAKVIVESGLELTRAGGIPT